MSKLPSADRVAAPPDAFTASEIALNTVRPFLAKSALVTSLPCQLTVQPPDCLAMLSAPGPATSTFAPGERQHRAFILEQHQRLRDRFARQRQMVGASDLVRREPVLARAVEEPDLGFHAKDPPDRVIEPALWQLAGAGVAQQAVVEALPAVGRHVHVEPGVERRRAIGDGAARDLAVRVPVADDAALRNPCDP